MKWWERALYLVIGIIVGATLSTALAQKTAADLGQWRLTPRIAPVQGNGCVLGWTLDPQHGDCVIALSVVATPDQKISSCSMHRSMAYQDVWFLVCTMPAEKHK